MVGTVFVDILVGEESEELENGDSGDEGEGEAMGSAVGAKEVSDGAGDEGGEESMDCEDGVLNGYAGTVGTVGFDRVGNGGTEGTAQGPRLGDGSFVCAKRTGAVRPMFLSPSTPATSTIVSTTAVTDVLGTIAATFLRCRAGRIDRPVVWSKKLLRRNSW
jgi:hypothetical protein